MNHRQENRAANSSDADLSRFAVVAAVIDDQKYNALEKYGLAVTKLTPCFSILA